MCLAVTCHRHFWQYDVSFLCAVSFSCATEVIREWNTGDQFLYDIFRHWSKRSKRNDMERIMCHMSRARIVFSTSIGNFIMHETGKRVWNVVCRNAARQLRFAFPAKHLLNFAEVHLANCDINYLSLPSDGGSNLRCLTVLFACWRSGLFSA